MNWRVYYGTGEAIDSDQSSLEDLPALDVQAVVYRDRNPESETGRVVVHRFDFYWWDEPDWYGGDLFGLFDYLSRPGLKKVLFGRTMPRTEDYGRIIARAADDPDFVRLPSR
jgi:hypothetical protein